MEISNIHFRHGELQEIETVEKAWGTELIVSRVPHGAKIMVLKPGEQVSLHFHVFKTESFILIDGGLIIKTITKAGEEEEFNLSSKFSSITIDRLTPHTFHCPDGQEEPTIFIEASTYDDPEDSYRIYPSGPRK